MVGIITFILEIIGTVAFAVSGAMIATEKKMDMLGVIILGLTTAVGGGVIRDIILGSTPPQAFSKPVYAIIAIITSLIIFIPQIRKLRQKNQIFFDKLLLIMDSLGLGIFTVVGISAAHNTSENIFLLIFVGVVTGVGGGVMRDVMSESTPFIFKKYFYCSASIIGAVITCILWNIVGENTAMLLGAGIIFILRVMAAHYRWKLPRA